MPTLTAAGALVTATAADRTLTYRLLPYGEAGATSAGSLTASAGTVTIPADPREVTLNLEHDHRTPVGRATTIEERGDGIYATFHVAPTRAGDDLLVEASEGLRTGVSVELRNAVIRAGRLISSMLGAAGAVVRPAFPTAQLVTAADAGEIAPAADQGEQDDDVPQTTGTDVPDQKEEPMPTAPAAPPAPAAPAPAAVPGDLNAGRRTDTPAPVTARQVSELLASAANGRRPDLLAVLGSPEISGTGDVFAALTSIPHDGAGAPGNAQRQPEWLGHIWQGKRYNRRYVSLLRSVPLTAYQLKGWKFTTKPGGATWAGNKTPVPSGPIVTAPHEYTASKWAGAHDHAREYRDFPNPDYWDSYWDAMADDYALDSDTEGLATLVAGATPVTVPAADIPAGVPEGLVKIVDGIIATLKYGTASYAVMAADLWREFILTPKDGALEYLTAATGVEEGTFTGFRIIPAPAPDIAAGSVLVGTQEAAEFRELPGVPLRVEGLDMVNGGVDTGLFGYHLTKVDEPLGLALVTTAP